VHTGKGEQRASAAREEDGMQERGQGLFSLLYALSLPPPPPPSLLLSLTLLLSCHYRSAVSDAAERMLRAARADAALKEEKRSFRKATSVIKPSKM